MVQNFSSFQTFSVDKILVQHLNYTLEPTLPSYEKITTPKGEVTGIKIKRLHYSVQYHRTDRNAAEVFHSTRGDFKPIFPNVEKFVVFSKHRSVLDLGCGGGSMVRDLNRLSVNIHGLDLFLTESQKKSPLFVQGDAFRIPFANVTKDIVLAQWSVFHYEPISQIGHLLKEVHRILKRNGSLWIPSLDHAERLYQLKVHCRRLNMLANIHLPYGIVECIKL